jgi:tRNA(Arg) A34 adenosine deaminase TadA
MGSNNKNANRLTNGAILIITVLKHIMSSAAEAEIGAVIINAKKGTLLRTTLEELGHHQPTTQHQEVTAMGEWNKNAHELWTCDFIG